MEQRKQFSSFQGTSLQDYPMNLLLCVRNKPEIELPVRICTDVETGLQYVLSSLSEAEQTVLQLRFQENKNYKQIAVALNLSETQVIKTEKNALRKLRQPGKWNYIRYGFEGFLKKIISDQYNKGYHTGYHEGYQKGILDQKNGDFHASEHSDLWILPVKSIGLSTRVVNSLCRWNDISVGELVQFHDDDIIRLKNMGPIGADEVARKLADLGFPNTAWSKHLL